VHDKFVGITEKMVAGTKECLTTAAFSAVNLIYNDAMPIGAGTKLGPYEIVALLGAGGMGEVYRARDTRLDSLQVVTVCEEK